MTRAHGQRGRTHGGRVVVTHVDVPVFKFDLQRVEAYLKARIPGIVIRRTEKGIDVKGRPFKPYNAEYAKRRLLAGRGSQPRLWLTGGMVGSFAFRASRAGADGLTVTFSPGASTSPSLSLTSKGAQQTGRRSPPHNLLAFYHQSGAGNLPRRRWVGLTKDEIKMVGKEVERLSGAWRLER